MGSDVLSTYFKHVNKYRICLSYGFCSRLILNVSKLFSLFSHSGESHYSAHEQPHVHFQFLILTGQFEAAIEFMARIKELRVHAVHIAIALNEHHLLAVPVNVQAPLCEYMEILQGA
jgi:hypothetical protein